MGCHQAGRPGVCRVGGKPPRDLSASGPFVQLEVFFLGSCYSQGTEAAAKGKADEDPVLLVARQKMPSQPGAIAGFQSHLCAEGSLPGSRGEMFGVPCWMGGPGLTGWKELGKDRPPAAARWVTLGTQSEVHTQGARGSRQRNAGPLPRRSLQIWVRILALELGSFVANERLTILGPSFVG